jgi:hypothetical protein
MPMQSRSARRRANAIGAAIALAFAASAAAQQGDSDADLQRQLREEGARLNDLYRALDEQQRQLDANRRQIDEQRRRIDSLLQQMTGRGLAPPESAARAGAGALEPPPLQQAQAQSPQQQQQRPVGEAPPQAEQPPQAAQIFSEPTVLTRTGTVTLEPSLQYIHASNNRVALVGFTIIPAITIGLIDIREVSRDAWYAAITARWGFASRWDADIKVPYVYNSMTTLTRPLATPSVTDESFEADGQGLGDIEFGTRYQINAFRGDNMVYIGSLRVRAPTGTGPFEVDYSPVTNLQTKLATGSGFWGVEGGVQFVFPSDPAVFFGALNYQYNFERDVGNGFGTIKPGNVAQFNVGMGLALNEKASFSFGYQQSVVSSFEQKGPASPGKTISTTGTTILGTARFGLTYQVTPKTAVNFTLGIGVTKNTPDLELTVRVPISFF